MKRFAMVLAFLAASLAVATAAASDVPVYGYTVTHAWPHDTRAYTEGLFYLDGYLYEGTGNVGQSFVRKVDLQTGKVLQQVATPGPDLFGEGIVAFGDRLIELTWRAQQGFVFDLATLKPLARFSYPGEGWGLTSDGRRLLMSDGTPTLRWLDPHTLQQVGRIDVTDGEPLANLNELEWVNGQIYANVWMTRRIARIDPATGKVVGWIDLGGLGPRPEDTVDPANDVLNGIAYDAADDRLFVTGKRWPQVYEIRLTGPRRN